jgi:RHS repeat-associated protein
VTKANQSVQARYDYLPFGEELSSGISGRTVVMGYGAADSTKQKFTGKERDAESGLDYFLARYYSSAQARFTSPDEFAGGPDELFDFPDHASANPVFYADLHEPQSLNKYQYCYNNPLSCIDPDGHKVVLKRRQIGTGSVGMVATAASMAQSPNPATSIIGTGLLVVALIGEALITRAPEPVPVPDTVGKTEAQPQTTTPPQTQVQPMAPPAPLQKNGKSRSEHDKHVKGREAARRVLRELTDKLGRAKGPKTRGPIEEAIRKLEKEIKGHEKEIRQKWPRGRP